MIATAGPGEIGTGLTLTAIRPSPAPQVAAAPSPSRLPGDPPGPFGHNGGMSRRVPAAGCHCGLPASYQDCCARFHRGESSAATAELLMRSRFSAFAVGDEAYLLRTWHPAGRPPRVDLDKKLRWVRLEVLETADGNVFHTEGTVRFRAHYLDRGRPGQLDEHSRFVRLDGRWVYAGVV